MFSKLYTTQPSNRKNSGFKPNVSAMNRLLAILEEIYQGFDDHNDSIFVYINIFWKLLIESCMSSFYSNLNNLLEWFSSDLSYNEEYWLVAFPVLKTSMQESLRVQSSALCYFLFTSTTWPFASHQQHDPLPPIKYPSICWPLKLTTDIQQPYPICGYLKPRFTYPFSMAWALASVF